MLILPSGVLALSLERSRQKWLTDGPFERYWTKPSKKRDMGNTVNPAKETMTRIGVCSMIIDPHVFEVTLYSVKDVPKSYAPPPVQPPSLLAPQYNPFISGRPYAPQNYNTHSPVQPPSYQGQPNNPSQQSLPPFREGFGALAPQGPATPFYRLPNLTSTPATASGPPKQIETSTIGQVSSQDENGEPDPVIQMLATRAASDPGLKALMKIVASGKATQPQLRDFQDHIDELNSLLKSRKTSITVIDNDKITSTSPPTRQESAPYSCHSLGHPDATAVQDLPASYAPPPIKVEPFAQPFSTNPPHVIKPSSSAKPEINGICFDFGGTGDRYSIPRFSILEYLYGGTQVIVSFIVIRPGNTATGANYKDNKSYYQPVTIRLTSPHSRMLEPLSRVVAPPNEVRNYMNSFFDRLNPAETVYLATRLPRRPDAEENEKQDNAVQPDIRLSRLTYSPPSSVMPLAA